MDNYSEHLIQIRKNAKMIGMTVLIWVLLLGIAAVSFLLIGNILLCLIITGVAIYGGISLTKMLNVEYEYIVTNGEFDVDMITSKSNRKRIISFNCKDIDRIEVYTDGCAMFEKDNYDKKSVYCNASDSDVYCISFKHKSIGKVCLVMQLPEKMREAMSPYVNKLIVREAFGE